MTKRSFEQINYMLRPNKNVERKLIARTLARLEPHFSIREFRYVGFGSMWFADFVLMHKILGITDLVTIEGEVTRSRRVAFNKPFGCISIEMGKAVEKLGKVLDGKRSLVWLDYDGPLKSALDGDIETAVGALPSGSIVIATVNARVDQLRNHKSEGEELTPAKYLAAITDTVVTPATESRLTRVDFPELVSEILHERIRSSVLGYKPGCDYRPIWTFAYADDADMVTAGGMIVNAADSSALDAAALEELPFVSADAPFEIALPILTEKEKRFLDRLMPSSRIVGRDLEFELKDAEIEAYRQFYLEYPVFNELAS